MAAGGKKSYDELMAELQEPEVAFAPPTPGEADAWDDVPDEYSTRITHPPGDYVLRMPMTLGALWEMIEAKDQNKQPLVQYGLELPEGAPGRDKGIRVRANFSDLDSLVIVRGPTPDLEGQPFETRLDNRARIRNHREVAQGSAPILVSDLEYLLRALGATQRPAIGQNRQFMALLAGDPKLNLPGYAGALFTATFEWSGYCNPEKNAKRWFPADEAHPEPYIGDWIDAQTQAPRIGCGARTYQNDWPKIAGGKFSPTGMCKGSKKQMGCQYAVIYPYGSLRNFRPAPPGIK